MTDQDAIKLQQEDTQHARLSMSRLPRIIDCPGSVPLYEAYLATVEHEPERRSEHANVGSFLHAVSEDYLTREVYEIFESLHEQQSIHLEYKGYVEDVLNWVGEQRQLHRIDDTYTEFIERKVYLKGFIPFCGGNDLFNDVFGTSDFMFTSNKGRTLHVCDWKFGHHLVYPDSPQLIGYAAGALRNPDYARRFDTVVTHIVQPRADDNIHKQEEFSVEDVLRWIKHVLSPALLKTKADPYILNPTPTACMFCPMKVHCTARRDYNMDVAAQAFATYAQPAGVMSLEEIAKALAAFESVDKYKKDLLKFAFNEIAAGREFPGRKIVAKSGRRAWVNEHKVVVALEEQGFELEDFSEVKMFSPAAVEKLIGRKRAKEEWFTDLCPKGQGSHTLVKDTDSRPAIVFSTASETFADYAEEDFEE